MIFGLIFFKWERTKLWSRISFEQVHHVSVQEFQELIMLLWKFSFLSYWLLCSYFSITGCSSSVRGSGEVWGSPFTLWTSEESVPFTTHSSVSFNAHYSPRTSNTSLRQENTKETQTLRSKENMDQNGAHQIRRSAQKIQRHTNRWNYSSRWNKKSVCSIINTSQIKIIAIIHYHSARRRVSEF